MKIELMFDNIVVATNSKEEDVLVLLPDLPERLIPRTLFLGNKTQVTLLELRSWVIDRIPPRNRADIKMLLKSFGLKKYDPLQVAFKTGACVMGNRWWIKTEESQTYQSFTLRGKAGKPEITLSDLT